MSDLFRMQPGRPDRAAHGYLYYRWTTAYMSVVRFALERGRALGPIRDFAATRLERTHHAKVVPVAEARRVISVDRPVEWRDLESAVPYPVARDVVLGAPSKIALARCACRSVAERRGERDGSCGPLEQCVYVGDPIASFVVEKQQGARFVTAEEALAVIDAAAARGNIHTLWFKDAADERMYAICNCCSCCCIGLRAAREGFKPLAGSGYVAQVDPELCTGCGRCVAACVFGAHALSRSDAGKLRSFVDRGRCLGCGACVQTCPVGAIGLVADPDGPAPLPWSRDDHA